MDDKREQLRQAIEAIIGPRPFVLAYDSTPIEDLIEDRSVSFDYCEPEHQAPYTSLGLIEYAAQAYGPNKEVNDH